eukprot:GHVL01023614.1.p1 GENE.GHVL01023614.1~~GHVL01023614.1.p1  ORF type:complete len:516 (-),score=106.73 GHVL01023614.1:149-1696(-)
MTEAAVMEVLCRRFLDHASSCRDDAKKSLQDLDHRSNQLRNEIARKCPENPMLDTSLMPKCIPQKQGKQWGWNEFINQVSESYKKANPEFVVNPETVSSRVFNESSQENEQKVVKNALQKDAKAKTKPKVTDNKIKKPISVTKASPKHGLAKLSRTDTPVGGGGRNGGTSVKNRQGLPPKGGTVGKPESDAHETSFGKSNGEVKDFCSPHFAAATASISEDSSIAAETEVSSPDNKKEIPPTFGSWSSSLLEEAKNQQTPYLQCASPDDVPTTPSPQLILQNPAMQGQEGMKNLSPMLCQIFVENGAATPGGSHQTTMAAWRESDTSGKLTNTTEPTRTPFISSVNMHHKHLNWTPVTPAGVPHLTRSKIELTSVNDEDQYEMSDEEDMDLSDREADEKRRGKRIPEWSKKENVMKAYKQQKSVNPDSIFGISIAKPHLEQIFPNNQWQNTQRVQHRRDSLNWANDRLTRQEIGEYESRMGFTRRVEHLVYEYVSVGRISPSLQTLEPPPASVLL